MDYPTTSGAASNAEGPAPLCCPSWSGVRAGKEILGLKDADQDPDCPSHLWPGLTSGPASPLARPHLWAGLTSGPGLFVPNQLARGWVHGLCRSGESTAGRDLALQNPRF